MGINIPQIFIEYKGKDILQKLPIGTIYGLGKNFDKHINELNWKEKEPVIFIKPRTALFNGSGKIILPHYSNEIHYEVELVLYIGKRGKDISPDKAYEHIHGLAVGVDLTCRDIQKRAKEKGHPWSVSKGFDQSALVSSFVPLDKSIILDDIELNLEKNGVVCQKGNTGEMILKPLAVIAFISSYFTLYPGDIIFAGTPEGVGPVEPGAKVNIQMVSNNEIKAEAEFLF